MEVVTETALSVFPLDTTQVPARPSVTLIVKAAFALCPNEPATVLAVAKQPPLAGDEIFLDDVGRSLRYASDLVATKLRGEVTLSAVGHPLHPTKSCEVGFALGNLRKSLRVSGDRAWPNPTTIGLFATMPIRWERAFGGLADPQNPLGRGVEPWPTPEGPVHFLPNIEYPSELVTRPEERPRAAGFGPLAPQWSPRRELQGTRDQRWAMFRAPLPPEDFNALFYQAAPSDQQLPDGVFFRGDELLELSNLHPKLASFRGSLPGKRLRLFLLRRATKTTPATFSEVPLALDTVHIDTEAETVALVWRQAVPLSRPLALEVECAYLAEEPLSEPAALLETHERRFHELRGPTPPPLSELIDADVAEARAEMKKVALEGGLDPALVEELASIEDPQALMNRIIQLAEAKMKEVEQLTASLKG